jgi:hypothetical protein
LGAVEGTARINIHPLAGSNSIKSPGASGGALDVTIDTVDRIAHDNKLEGIDLLKIDVEGYELPVLHGASKHLNEGLVRFVYLECVFSPNSEMPHTSFFEIHHLLEEAGFCFVNYYAESFNLRLGCSMGNALYALRKRLPRSVPGKVHNIV